MKQVLLVLMCLFSTGHAAAQVIPDSTETSEAIQPISIDSTSVSIDSILTTAGIADSIPSPGMAPLADWTREDIRLLEYHHLADILRLPPVLVLHHLGNFGQPVTLRAYGAQPAQTSITVGGLAHDDLISGMMQSYLHSTEDVQRINVYPQYQSFWYGHPGDVYAADVEQMEWNAPRPITRMRHTEASNEYLFTDGMFTLNLSETSNLYIAGTRTVIGSASSNNAARFPNNRYESWNLRGSYRNQLTELLRLNTTVRYHDHFTMLNGGILGTFTPHTTTPLTYEDESIGPFAGEAFDPKAAFLLNESMETLRQRYDATVELLMQWTADSSQATRLQINATSDVRRFRDNLQRLWTDSLAIPWFNLTDEWSQLQARLSHRTTLSWANLLIEGQLGRYTAAKGDGALDEAGILAAAKGRLDLMLGPATLSGFASLEHRFEQSGISFGAGVELPVGPFSLWGGFSFSPRLRTLLETMYEPRLLDISGDRTPDLDKITVAEGGMRWTSPSLSAGMHGFLRYEERYQVLQTAAYYDSIPGRYTFFVSAIPDGAAVTVYGGSASLSATLWDLHLDQDYTWTQHDSDHPTLGLRTVPAHQYRAELYYKGMLIEGTLNLKVGGRFTAATDYLPLTYHPEAGIFTLPKDLDPGLVSYTDMMRFDLFLFATIKERATLHVSMHNVLDTEYITAGFYPMYDRALRFGVDWIFLD